MSDVKMKTIFLVDDSATNLVMGRDLLLYAYNTYTCNSGTRMFALLERLKPDLILLDIEMPDMDGFEVLGRLKNDQNTANIPVILLTADGNKETETRGRSLGAADYMTKPFSPPLLFASIEKQLGANNARPQKAVI